MFYTFNVLIVLVAFACYQDSISRLGKHTSGFDGFFSIYYADDFPHIFFPESCQHVVDDVLRFLKSRVVGSDDDLVALFDCFLCHDGAFTFVAIAARTYNGDDVASSVQYFLNGVQDIDQSVGGMGVIDNCTISSW